MSAPGADLERVVVGIDFAGPATEAAEWVGGALAPGAELVLVHALEVPDAPRFARPDPGMPRALLREARDEAVRRLEELRRSLPPERIRVEVRKGAADEVLSAVAEESGADLVVVGEHGGRARGSAEPEGSRSTRRGTGSTAERMLHASPAPVLLARNLPDGPPGRALVAVDDSDRTRAVLAWAALLQRSFGTGLEVCHVFQTVYAGVSGLLSGDEAARRLGPAQREQAREWLESEARETGLDEERTRVAIAEGDPAREILGREERDAPDLVVMGSRGAGRVGRAFLGSVAATVVREGVRPVLVVRTAGG